MTTIILDGRADVAFVRLHSGVTNPIGRQLIDDLHQTLKTVKTDFRGMILAGGPKFFSIGLNLPELLSLDRMEMRDFFFRFNRVALELYSLPLPTACVISGHAVAGGNILALTCDYRYMGGGKKLIGLNEIRLGVPIPYLADLMVRQIAGDRAATEMLYRGEFLNATAAKQIGLIDQIFANEDLEKEALKKIAELAALPQPAFATNKANRIERILARYKQHHNEKHETFLDCWFSEETQVLLKKAVEKF